MDYYLVRSDSGQQQQKFEREMAGLSVSQQHGAAGFSSGDTAQQLGAAASGEHERWAEKSKRWVFKIRRCLY
jgi:hypothetical protein